jgi:2',3'-cyclic-nucleotide 2'-phosphodiesterase (5'-nucleotidase family)
VLDKLAPANVLVLDSGNALFANAGVATEPEKLRAAFILGVMEQLGTKVMAVGQRDLSAGLPFLQNLAKTSKVKLLSANLTRGGKRVFEPSVVIDAGGVKVGIIGLTAVGPVAPDKDVTSGGTLEAARVALKALGPRDVTIVLAATTYADGMQLSTELKGEVDFVIQSGEFRGTQPAQRLDETSALLFASAQKGQALAKVQLSLGSAKGPFVDLSVADRDQQQADFLKSQVTMLEERLKKATDKSITGDLQKTLGELKKRQKELADGLAKRAAPTAKTVKLEWVMLGQDVADDPKIKAEVLEYEPTYSGSH